MSGCASRLDRVSPTVPRPAGLIDPGPIARPVAEPDDGHLPSPDLSDASVLRRVAGIRPYRAGSVRVEHESTGWGHLIHHYGHGGAGITLAWGTAEQAADLVQQALPRGRVAVLGCGVVGLSTAVVLAERGRAVTIYTRDLPEQTTSMVAGGQFAPSLVEAGSTEQMRQWLEASARRYRKLLGSSWGVSEVPNYVVGRAGGALAKLPRPGFDYRALERLPFAGPARRGGVYQTLLIEPPIYLPSLLAHVRSLGVCVERRTFESMEQVAELDEKAVVNCLGLGARQLVDDPALIPLRGQLVLLRPQPLGYLLSHSGYLFARQDAVVLGGTIERGIDLPQTTEHDCRRILNRHRAFFG